MNQDIGDKILIVVKKISDLKEDAEVENFFECTDCGNHIFYIKIPLTDEEGWIFICAICGKVFPGL